MQDAYSVVLGDGTTGMANTRLPRSCQNVGRELVELDSMKANAPQVVRHS